MIDSHSHLFAKDFENDVEECLARCKENNVNKIIIVGFTRETNCKAYEMSLRYSNLYPTAGLHPEEIYDNYEEELDNLYNFIKTHKVYAVGECGIDFHYRTDNKDIQEIVFRKQIEYSIEFNLPLIVHMRDATEFTYNILKDYKGRIKGVMHCYSGSYEMALKFIDLGMYISLGGPVTFKNAKVPKEIASSIPKNKLLIETDCPYLAPTPYRGKRNESSYVYHVAKEIATLKNMTLEEIDELTTKNTMDLFDLRKEQL